MSTGGLETQVGNSSFRLPSQPSLPVQDLSDDNFVSRASKIEVEGQTRPTPSLGGIPLLAKLGQGGMGAVYYGIHPRLKVEVAVKVLPFHLAERNAQLVERFYREAQIAAKVRSERLVDVKDVNQENGIYYLVMEFVQGESAGSYLRKQLQAGKKGLCELIALDICIAACEGLVAAHKAGIVHRDIKPDNIMLPRSEDGDRLQYTQAKLADLGLARSDSGENTHLTGTMVSMGTPGFMAPEQGMDAKNAGKPADIFSMGATLYALLSGQAPFHGSAIMKVLLETAQTPHKSIRTLRPEIGEPTAVLLDRCLAKDPAQRFEDASQLLDALKIARLAASEPEATRQISSSSHSVLRAALKTQISNSASPANAPVTGMAKINRFGFVALGLVVLSAALGLWKGSQTKIAGRPLGDNLLTDNNPTLKVPVAEAAPAPEIPLASIESLVAAELENQLALQVASDRLRSADELARQLEDAQQRRQDQAIQAFTTALNLALEAKKQGEWAQILTALEDPLSALGETPHPNRKAAEALIEQARVELLKRDTLETRLAEAEAFLNAGLYDRAEEAYRAADENAATTLARERIEAGLQAVEAGRRQERYRKAMQSAQSALETGDFTAVVSHYRAALNEQPADLAATNGLSAANERLQAQLRTIQVEHESVVLGELKTALENKNATGRSPKKLGDALRKDFEKAFQVSLTNNSRDGGEVRPNWPMWDGRETIAEYARRAGLEPTKTLHLNGIPLELVLIPAGRFLMGSPAHEAEREGNEGRYEVTLSRPFYMGKYEVTQAQWQAVMGNNPSHFKGEHLPVDSVSWDDVQSFLRRAGQRLRLPTEAQWEWACRAGTAAPFHTGSNLTTDEANFDGLQPYAGGLQGVQRGTTLAVGRLKPNAFGLYDLHGNVWEWCSDWYGDYPREAVEDPRGATLGTQRVLRGGSWDFGARICRSAFRGFNTPDNRYRSNGFRLCTGVGLRAP